MSIIPLCCGILRLPGVFADGPVPDTIPKGSMPQPRRPASDRPSSADEADTILRALVTVAEPLGRLFPLAELAVHDLRRRPHSLIAIYGHVTGRQVGDELAPYALAAIDQGDAAALLSHPWRTAHGRDVVSSTVVVPAGDGTPVAALSMNCDPRLWGAVATVALALLPRPEATPAEDANPAGAVDVLADDVLSSAIAAIGVPVDLMQKRHKVMVVKDLKERGFFALRESVERAAQALAVTRFTIYNYLKEL